MFFSFLLKSNVTQHLQTPMQLSNIVKNLCRIFFMVCLNMCCRWKSNYQEGRVNVGIPLTGLIFMSVPSQGLVFKRHMSWFIFFMFTQLT